jgi:hypothetical protein
MGAMTGFYVNLCLAPEVRRQYPGVSFEIDADGLDDDIIVTLHLESGDREISDEEIMRVKDEREAHDDIAKEATMA